MMSIKPCRGFALSRVIGLSILLWSLSTVVCFAQVADLMVGTIQLPAGWTQKRTGTKDSEAGQATRADKMLTVNYDIGFMAGAHMSESRKSECVWYKEQVIHGHRVLIGLIKTNAGRELVVTVFDAGVTGPLKYPANFWATVQNDEDVTDTLIIALSYEAKP